MPSLHTLWVYLYFFCRNYALFYPLIVSLLAGNGCVIPFAKSDFIISQPKVE